MPSKKLPKSSKAGSLIPNGVHVHAMPNSKANGDTSVPHKASGKKIGGAKRHADDSGDSVNPKRRKGLGVRIIGGRIYDSENGQTCHQCRQKMIEYMVHCKSVIGQKACTHNFCDKCLQNRYGENATEMALVETWICPKCRGVCNCSICLKKQGRQPTGNLSKTAKATGFNSVADLLQKFPEMKAENMMSVGEGNPKKSVSSLLTAVDDLKVISKCSDHPYPKIAVSIKAPSTSLALVSLTNQDLSIASSCKGRNEVVDSKSMKGTNIKGEFVHTNGSKAVVHSNIEIVLKDKAKRIKSEIQVSKGSGSGSLVEEDNMTKKAFRKGMKTVQVGEDAKVSIAMKTSPSISSPAQSVSTKLKKRDNDKTAINGQAAERKGKLLLKSCNALTVEIDGENGVANGSCSKTAVDGHDGHMGMDPDLKTCNLDIKSSRQGNSVTKKSTSGKLIVTVDGKIQVATTGASPTPKKKGAHLKQRPNQTSAPGNEEAAGTGISPCFQSGSAGQALSTKASNRKRTVSENADLDLGVGKPEERANASKSKIPSEEGPPTGFPGDSVEVKARKYKRKVAGKVSTKRVDVKAAIGAQNCEEDLSNKPKTKPLGGGNCQGILVETGKIEFVKEKKTQALQKKPKRKVIGDVDGQGTLVETIKSEVGNGKQTQPLPKKPENKKGKVVGECDAQRNVVKTENAGHKRGRKKIKQKGPPPEVETVLPSGEPLVTVAGIEFPSQAVGPALQLTEFCSAFHRILGLKKGEIEALLRELTKPRLMRRGSQSLLIQLHVKLLTFIEEDSSEPCTITYSSSGRDSWLTALARHLNEKSCVFASNAVCCNGEDSRVIPEKDLRALKQAIEEGPEGYEKLELYHKLQLLSVLSDDCLDTECLRNFIDSVNHDFRQAQKENREEALVARKEAKEVRQKIRDAQVGKLLALSNLTGPLLPEEKEALLTEVKQNVAAARSMMREAASKPHKNRSDAVRTDAILLGKDGRAFYRLKGAFNRTCVVFQDMSNISWSVYSEADEAVFAKYMSSCSARQKIVAEQQQSVGGIPESEMSAEALKDCEEAGKML